MSKKILVTGACGFIGHHFIQHLLINTDWDIIILDKLNYASIGFERIRDIGVFQNSRVKVLTFDLQYELTIGMIKEIGTNIDYIVHMAAETHVDNSISEPVSFIHNNVMSTVHLLEFARKCTNLQQFFYFSTDEVYGPALNDKLFKEDERHNPTNPYSASKSAAEQICVAYGNTYTIPIIRINVMNAFGERQHVEKFIPKVIKQILNDEVVLIHSYPDRQQSGSRFYIHARNIAAAVLFLIKNGTIGESYNLTGEKEITNLEMAELIASIIGKPLKYELVDFHSSRPGHDLRYGLDGSKMECMGWKMPVGFDESIKKTILWTLKNIKWLEEI
jgi:dTDP-glucose 4,6-dehydratase